MTDRMWEGLCRAAGREDLSADARFATSKARHENREALWALLEEAFLARTADEWVAILEREGVPAGTVNTLDRVVADPQIAERGMVIGLDAGDGRHIRVMGDPLFMKESRRSDHTYPPAAGENSADILSNVLGLPSEEIARLIGKGVIKGKAPTEPVEQET